MLNHYCPYILKFNKRINIIKDLHVSSPVQMTGNEWFESDVNSEIS